MVTDFPLWVDLLRYIATGGGLLMMILACLFEFMREKKIVRVKISSALVNTGLVFWGWVIALTFAATFYDKASSKPLNVLFLSFVIFLILTLSYYGFYLVNKHRVFWKKALGITAALVGITSLFLMIFFFRT